MNDLTNLFKLFTDENRIEIIKRLIDGETCGCTLIDQMPITQPTLSYHLKMISSAGLSNTVKEGNWVKHHIDFNKIDEMIEFLEELKNREVISCKS